MHLALFLLALGQVPDYSAVRQARAERLNAEKGWLSVAGLTWLDEGENSVGSDPASRVVLPARAPSRFGTLVRRGKRVLFRPSDASQEKPVTEDVKVGDVTFAIIVRGDRVGVRLWDPLRPARLAFRGLHWFAPDPRYRIAARYVRYPKPRTLNIVNVLGDSTPVPSSGFVQFKLDGKVCRLQAEDAEDGLFINFQDATSGVSTYSAGRFLDTPRPVGDWVMIDFNLAVNPPCAYTEFATCPLPPAGNRLSVAIRAGEKRYH